MRSLVLLIALATPSLAADPKPTVRAGAFAVDVTPEHFPISVNGGMADNQAKSAHDRLHARCLVLPSFREMTCSVVWFSDAQSRVKIKTA